MNLKVHYHVRRNSLFAPVLTHISSKAHLDVVIVSVYITQMALSFEIYYAFLILHMCACVFLTLSY